MLIEPVSPRFLAVFCLAANHLIAEHDARLRIRRRPISIAETGRLLSDYVAQEFFHEMDALLGKRP